MHKLVALLALCALTAAAAAQTISLDFDSIPVGTRATDIELPGINIWEDDPRFTGGIRSGCHWVVVDLATLVQSTAATGVEMAPPKHSSGNVLACVNQHEPCTPSYAICDGSLLVTDLYIESTSTLASADVVIGGLGCLNDGGYGGLVDQRECTMNVIPGTLDPLFFRDTDGTFSLKDIPGLDVDASGHVSKSRRFTWVVFGGYGFVGSHRYPATTALFIDKVSLNLESPTDCGPPGPVRLEPPFDQHNEAIPVTAGETVRVAWKPFSFPANVSYRHFTVFMFPVPYGFRYIGTVNVPEATTVVDFMIPRRYAGDYTARLNVWPAGSCEGRGWWPNPSYFGPLLQVHDPAPPPRVDSVVPRFAKPGAVVEVRGDGFVPAGLTVTVGGKSADRILVDNQLMRVTVPQLDDGPAEITVTTAYGTVTVPPSSGLFTVGTPPPRRHPVRR